MKIDQLIIGAYRTNCYVLRESEKSRECVLIDTGLDGEELLDFFKEKKLEVVSVVITHGHADHIIGLEAIRDKYPAVKTYIHTDDAKMLTDAGENLSGLVGMDFVTGQADFLLRDGDALELGGIRLEVLHTPGHTRGGISLYCRDEKVVFTGDSLFADSIGRTDFEGGNMEQLISGIKKKLLVLDDETVVYPGHGPATTIGRERRFNQYLQ